MELTVMRWLRDFLVPLIGKTVELLFRVLLCLLPLGVYMVILQKRVKASSTRTISVYTKENSKFQHVFPGFLLVSIDPDSLSSYLAKAHNNVQNWIQRNKYIIALLFMSAIVGLMILSYIRGGKVW
jgi:hypothetical protein